MNHPLLPSVPQVMRLLCHVLRESHRCRLLFRKCNGFVRVIQEVVRLTGHFAPQNLTAADNSTPITDPISPQLLTSESKRQLLLLVKAVIAVLTLAMTFEPASAKHFAVEVSPPPSLSVVSFHVM
ncbi:unnamed protein product [Dibothriocephalus latus]|uniref:Uncharacterized protein n=1 Tax=Dibothriocephalus latus TaxID=60516 RepID=A0A3P7NB98_DIBLA|nr:unnamed protein product [Dibothriocephalus latus]